MDLIHSHLPQCRFPPRRRPALQISQIHGSYRALRQRESPGHLPRRCAFARLPHHLFESLLNGALLGNCSTRSVLIPHSGHRIRYNSITTVVRNSKHARSRISRSYTSWISLTRCPHLEHISFRFPAFRRTHSFSALACSSISCWYT